MDLITRLKTGPGQDGMLPIARMCFFAICAYLLTAIALNPDHNFIFNEVYRFTLPNALADGYAPSWRDFIRALDWPAHDGVPRARILSPLAGIFDAKLKIWLAGFGLYLPTVSITWPLVFVLAPIMLWQVIRHMLSPTAAWIGLCFYMTAASVMSVASMTMHAGKPLNLFFSMLILWLYHRLQQHDMKGGGKAATAGLVAAILLAQLLALASDESALCMVGVAPVLFFEFVWRRPAGRWAAAAGVAGLLLFIAWARFALPALVAAAGYEPFAMNAGHYVDAALDRLHQLPDMALRFGWTLYATLAQPLPFFDLVAWHARPDAAPVYPAAPSMFAPELREKLLFDPARAAAGPVIAWAAVVFALGLAYAAAMLRGAAPERRLALKALVALCGIVVMQAIIFGRSSFSYGLYYQGGPAALPYAMLLAAVLAPVARNGLEQLFKAALLGALVLGALWNHMAEFRYWSVWDGQGAPHWLRVMNVHAEAAPVFARERERLVAWAGTHDIDSSRIEVFLPWSGAIPGESANTFPLRRKLSLSVIAGLKPEMQPGCDICATVSPDGIVALRLKGRARDLPAPDFIGTAKLLRE